MTLATMKTGPKKDEIKKFLRSKTNALDWSMANSSVTWLGGNDLTISGTLIWNDQEMIGPDAGTWFDREPSKNKTKRCVSLVNFELYKENCSDLWYYLCERKPKPCYRNKNN